MTPTPTASTEQASEPYPTTTRPYKQSLGERLYLPLVGGLFVTLRHFVRNLLNPGKMVTIEYPE